jgi:hypothetical protein
LQPGKGEESMGDGSIIYNVFPTEESEDEDHEEANEPNPH